MNDLCLITLMFHRLGIPRGIADTYAIPPDWLTRVLSRPAGKDCNFIRLSNLLEGNSAITNMLVALTFDDGHKSDYVHALPLLKDVNIPATFFIVTTWIGQPGHLTWEQVRELAENGMEIGSHTCTHPWLPELSEEQIRMEMAQSRQEIGEQIGQEVASISLPGGYYNRRVIRMAFETGYRVVASSDYGIDTLASGRPQDRLFLKRNSIDQRSSWTYVTDLLAGKISPRILLINRAKRLVSALIGPTRYKSLADWKDKKVSAPN